VAKSAKTMTILHSNIYLNGPWAGPSGAGPSKPNILAMSPISGRCKQTSLTQLSHCLGKEVHMLMSFHLTNNPIPDNIRFIACLTVFCNINKIALKTEPMIKLA
jgi:hypothetical protein